MRRWTLMCCILFAACGGSDDPTRPAEGLGGFELEFSDDVRVHTPVELTVRAVGDAGTSPFTGFSGTVELSIDKGVVEPASLELVGGIGSEMVTITRTDEPPTLTARGGEHTGSLSFEIGRFQTTGTVAVIGGTIRPNATARIQLPEKELEENRVTTYVLPFPGNLFKSVVAEQVHDGRAETATSSSLAQFDSNILTSETSLLLDLNTVSAGAATGFSADVKADAGASHLGSFEFEVVGEPLLFELVVHTVRQFDKGMSCVGGMFLTHRSPEGQFTSIANLANANETMVGVLQPGTYTLRFDTTAVARSEKPEQIVSSLNFDIQLRVQR